MMSFLVIESYFKGQISAKLMTGLFLDPLLAVKLIETVENKDGNQKQYRANPNHPLFSNP